MVKITADSLKSAPARRSAVKQIASEMLNDSVVIAPVAQGYAYVSNGRSEFAMDRIRELKGLNPQTSLVRLVANFEQVEELCGALTSEQIRLLQRYWPGPLIAERETLPELRYSFGSRKLPDTIFFTQASHRLVIGACKEVGPLAFSPIMINEISSGERQILTDLAKIPAKVEESIALAIEDGNEWSTAKSTHISCPGVEVVIKKIGDITAESIIEVVPRARIENKSNQV